MKIYHMLYSFLQIGDTFSIDKYIWYTNVEHTHCRDDAPLTTIYVNKRQSLCLVENIISIWNSVGLELFGFYLTHIQLHLRHYL